jgi:hypothetical protein
LHPTSSAIRLLVGRAQVEFAGNNLGVWGHRKLGRRLPAPEFVQEDSLPLQKLEKLLSGKEKISLS